MKTLSLLLALSILAGSSITAAATPPRLVISDPANHSGGVPLDQGEIRLFFDRPMKQNAWTLYPLPGLSFPPLTDDNKRPWLDATTFTLKIRELAPATSYGLQLNSPSRQGFQAAEDQTPLEVTTLRFTTIGTDAVAKSEPTAAETPSGTPEDTPAETTPEAPAPSSVASPETQTDAEAQQPAQVAEKTGEPLPLPVPGSAETEIEAEPVTETNIEPEADAKAAAEAEPPAGSNAAPNAKAEPESSEAATPSSETSASPTPRIVVSIPVNGTDTVPIDLGEIRFSFDQSMKMNTWSLFRVPGKTFPPLKPDGAQWLDPQTFVLAIEPLQPDTEYALQLNNDKRKGFQTAEDQRALEVTLVTFSTKVPAPPPTPPASTPSSGEDAPPAPTEGESPEAEQTAPPEPQKPAPTEPPAAEKRTTPLSDQEKFVLRYYGALFGVFFHEFGHALVDELGLPITGREEDVVDELSTMILLMVREEMREEGTEMILGWAGFWGAEANKEGHRKSPWWDNHSPDMVRFGDIICLLYGSDPEEFEPLMDKLKVPDKRKLQCRLRFMEREQSWQRLMKPHLTEFGARGPGTIHLDMTPEPKSEFGKEIKKAFVEEKVWEQIIEGLNTALAFPKDFDVTLKDCDAVNAYWSYGERSIIVCYELLEDIYQQYTKQSEDKENGDKETGDDKVSLVGTWQYQSVDLIGMPALITTALNDDHSFISVSQAHGLDFEMRIEGRWEVSEGNAVVYHMDSWYPRQFCTFTGCQALRVPAKLRVTYEVIDEKTLKDVNNDVIIYRLE